MSEANQLDREVVEMAISLARSLKANGFNNQEIAFKLRKRFDDHEIAAALTELERSAPSHDGSVALKDKEQEYLGWYEGPKLGADSHWSRLVKHLGLKENAWSEEMIRSLDGASTMVVSYLAPPKSDKPICAKGLVLGYIQSGKTANFSATIAKAVDEGYKLVIVLAGLHNNLRRQTELRLREELVDPASGKTCTTLTDVDENGDFKRRQPISANSQLNRRDGFTLVVLKKNSPVLRNFLSWLKDASPDVIQNCPTLIIDDEADQASINTNKPPEESPTAINAHIRNIVGSFRVVSYVGYTATPFANVFIDSEVSDDLYPKDFLITLEKPETYYGPEELFGRDNVNGKAAREGLPVVRFVPVDDALVNAKKNKSIDIEITPSLSTAILSFLVAGAIRLTRNQWREHITMLVHFSHLTNPQETLREKVETLVAEIRNKIEDNDAATRKDIHDLWRKDYAEVTKTVTGRLDHEFEKVWGNIIKFIERLEVVMDNSKSDDRLTFDRSLREGEPLWGIVIGGNTLSRGLTVEGLTTSYFTRSSKAYDTLLQMGRWFGYRRGFVDVTRIFVSEDLYEKFYNLATMEQEIRDEIKAMASNNERPIDVALRIRQLPGMSITATNKMRTATASDLTYSGTKIQTHQLVVDNKTLLFSNEKAIVSLLEHVSRSSEKQQIRFLDLQQCSLYTRVSHELILQFLEGFSVTENNIKFHKKQMIDYILESNSRSELLEWSVAVMSLKSGQEVSVGPTKAIPLNRSVKHEVVLPSVGTEVTLRAVSTPGEELIDLADQIKVPFERTDDILEPKGGEKLSDVQARQRYRPKGRGLLMIYPLESNVQMTDEEFKSQKKPSSASYPLKAIHQVYAISVVFPCSDGARGAKVYLKNRTV